MAKAETPQESRYHTARRAWEAAWHRPLDRHERSLLYLITADAGLWAWARPRLDAAEERVDLHGGAELNPAQRLLLDVARTLYGEDSLVNLAVLADDLDERQFATVLAALRAYREHTDPAEAAQAAAGLAAAPPILQETKPAPASSRRDPGRSRTS